MSPRRNGWRPLKFQRRLPHAPRYRAFVRGFLFEQGNRSLHPMVPGEGERCGQHSLSGFCAVRRTGHKVDSTPLLTFGSPVLQDHSSAGNDHFSHWRAAAAIAQHGALADSTHAKRNSSWRRYECFLEFMGVDSILFSDSLDDKSNSKPLPASPTRVEKDDWKPEELQRIALEPRPELFVPPSTVWLRPIGLTNLRAPSTTDTDNSNQFWPSS